MIVAPAPSGDLTGAADTGALQAMASALVPANQTPNSRLQLRDGTYYLNDTLTTRASRYALCGEGKGATVLQWAGPPGIPMLEVINPYSVALEDFDLYGSGGSAPSDAIRVHRTGTVSGSEGIHYFRAERMRIGSGASNNLANGIHFLNDLNSDGNNDFGVLEDIEIDLCSKYGVWVDGLNTLAHRFNDLTINNCGRAAISNKPATGATKGGDYLSYGLVTNGNASVFEFFDVQGHIQVFGLRSEGDTYLITTPAPITSPMCQYSLIGGYAALVGGPVINFDASDPRSALRLADLVLMAAGDSYSFPGRADVEFAHCAMNMSAVSYNGNLDISHSRTFNGRPPQFTNLGSGTRALSFNRGGLAAMA